MQYCRIDMDIETPFIPGIQVVGCPGEAVRCVFVPSYRSVNFKLTILPPPALHIR